MRDRPNVFMTKPLAKDEVDALRERGPCDSAWPSCELRASLARRKKLKLGRTAESMEGRGSENEDRVLVGEVSAFVEDEFGDERLAVASGSFRVSISSDSSLLRDDAGKWMLFRPGIVSDGSTDMLPRRLELDPGPLGRLSTSDDAEAHFFMVDLRLFLPIELEPFDLPLDLGEGV